MNQKERDLPRFKAILFGTTGLSDRPYGDETLNAKIL
jgi:hypothetical protein